MEIKVLGFRPTNKPAVLASVRIELVTETGDAITIDDARVLRNRNQQLWLAMPAYSTPTTSRSGYDYLPAVLLSTGLRRAVEDAVLAGFEKWEREKASASNEHAQ
jgi:hypothetical protein